MKTNRKFKSLFLISAAIASGVLASLLGTDAVMAQALPSSMQQEVLIKETLLTFNDANVTDNYTVLNAKLSKPFRDQFPPEKLAAGFKGFSDHHIDISGIAALPPISEGEAEIDSEGVLKLRGHFDTTPKKVKYDLGFIRSEGQWKAVKLTINID